MKKILDNKIFKVIYGTIKFAFFAIIILYVAFIAIQRFGNNNSIMGYRLFTIATGSMEPDYVVGDVILVKEHKYEDLKVGDDITYLGNKADFKDKIVTHRIIEINKEDKTIQTQGTANFAPDPVIDDEQVYGKVTYKFTLLSMLTKLTKNKFGFYFLIFVPLVLVIFLEIADVVTNREDDDDEKTSE